MVEHYYRIELLVGGDVVATTDVWATHPDRAYKRALKALQRAMGSDEIEADQYRWTVLYETERDDR